MMATMPPTAPTMRDSTGMTAWQREVMDTSPARVPVTVSYTHTNWPLWPLQ